MARCAPGAPYNCLLRSLYVKYEVSYLTFTYDHTGVSADGIQKSEPAPDTQEAIPEAGKGFDGTEKEILETMKMHDSRGFDEDEG